MIDCWIILLDRVDDARCWSQLTDPRFLLAWVMDGRTRARRPLVVFKDTFRSRQYWCRTSTMFRFFILLISILNWHELDPLSMRVLITCSLVECSDICNLLKDGEDDQ